jgi:DNA polymerase I
MSCCHVFGGSAGADLNGCRSLLLVDGMAVAYRAFHAISGLSARDGRKTNAVYGFVKMMIRLDALWRPSHRAVVFEGGLPTARLALLPEYKAQRPPMPDDLREQLPACRGYLEAARIRSVTVAGEEADDVMASIARHAQGLMGQVLIATSDKDLYQIVNENIRVVPVSGSGRTAWGAEEIIAKTGVRPDQIAAWLALTGDSADNIPGVPGVGPKTAARLLNRFSDLDGLYRNLHDWPGTKVREALASARDMVYRNYDAIRLREEAVSPIGDWEPWGRRESNAQALHEFFENMEFDSLAAQSRQQELF